jgi:hypothetical protein
MRAGRSPSANTDATVSPFPEYDLLLDAIVPLEVVRADHRGWDSERWGHVLGAADWHRLSPILWCHLEHRPLVPAAVRSALERAYLAACARSLYIAEAQCRVVEALRAQDVPVLLLKGAALLETVYPDPAQREMLDLDILVPSDRVATATRALALGWIRIESDGRAATSTQLEQDQHHGPALVGAEQLVAVELHHHIAISGEGNGFAVDELWQRARTSRNGDHLLPSPEDLLLHVSLHFTRNRLGGSYIRRNTGGALAQISDIARIVEREPVRWELVTASASSFGLDTRVFLALFAARELGVPIPESALAALQPAGFDKSLGRRLVALRVLRAGDHLPVRTVRWMFAPSRDVLTRGWNADPTAPSSLARAYIRRAKAHAPLARSALRRPRMLIQDRRLNDQIRALEDRA